MQKILITDIISGHGTNAAICCCFGEADCNLKVYDMRRLSNHWGESITIMEVVE